MEKQVFNILGQEYIVKPTETSEDQYIGKNFHFTCIDVYYEITIGETGELILTRCPDGVCDYCGSNFTSLKEAVQFADLYERLLQFTFFTEESKETAINRILDVVQNQFPKYGPYKQVKYFRCQ